MFLQRESATNQTTACDQTHRSSSACCLTFTALKVTRTHSQPDDCYRRMFAAPPAAQLETLNKEISISRGRKAPLFPPQGRVQWSRAGDQENQKVCRDVFSRHTKNESDGARPAGTSRLQTQIRGERDGRRRSPALFSLRQYRLHPSALPRSIIIIIIIF